MPVLTLILSSTPSRCHLDAVRTEAADRPVVSFFVACWAGRWGGAQEAQAAAFEVVGTEAVKVADAVPRALAAAEKHLDDVGVDRPAWCAWVSEADLAVDSGQAPAWI
ncbi:hypothetical protein AB0L10_22935 [Streptomyces flaveolus]|uniref:hypothetical protein n=1 Tax=Streptomyces flaveolus TaxID=67297 RepID=UPI0034285C05